MELWILGATTGANEQLETSLFRSGLKQGVPVLVIDWKASVAMPSLAALSISSPEIVRQFAGDVAADAATRIGAGGAGAAALDELRREMAAWNVGYGSVRDAAQAWMRRLWGSPTVSVAVLGQDAAGGAEPASIVRTAIHAQLDGWRDFGAQDAPAVLVGEEGMGKTWAGVGWLEANLASLPAVVVVPSGMVTATAGTAAGLLHLLGVRLHEITGTRDAAFWSARVDRMLRRPAGEGATFLLMLDGMNQEPRAPWVALLQNLQASPFAGGVRVVASTRPFSFEGEMRSLSRLVVQPVRIDVGSYDDAPGGEFERMLAHHGLQRADIPDDLVPLARVPRLLELVIRLKDRLAGVGRITVHGLLWEYGRDTLGVRGGRSFTEAEWREWLAQVAERFRATGAHALPMRELELTTARPSLDPSQVQARLSDIVDGQVADADSRGRVVLRPEIVAQALGAAVIAELEDVAGRDPVAVPAALEAWLGPIAGFTERSEILRAAMAIAASPGSTVDQTVSAALVAAWISSRNLPDDHRRDITAVAPRMLPGFLAAVAAMGGQSMAAARDLAIDAVRSIPRSDAASRDLVRDAVTGWMRTVSRDADGHRSRSDEGERTRVARLTSRTGSDEDGDRDVLGQRLSFVRSTSGHALAHVPALIDGYPLEPFIELFELAALQLAVRGHFPTWSSFEWLTLWNGSDFAVAANALRNRAAEVIGRPVEVGVEPRLRQRVAALLLWLTSDPVDEGSARAIDPRLDAFHSYEADYEASPGTSMFALERRHAEAVMADAAISAIERMRRLENFWWDPSLTVPTDMAASVNDAAEAFGVNRLSTGRFRNADDLDLDRIEVAVARCAPAALGRLVRRRITALGTIAEGRPRLGRAAYEALLVGSDATMALLADQSTTTAETEGEADDDGVRQILMQPALIDLDGELQVEAIIAADLRNIYTNINAFLRTLDAEAVDRLVARHGHQAIEPAQRLIELLSEMAINLSGDAAAWLTTLAFDERFDRQATAFETLARCRPEILGDRLITDDWTWDTAEDDHSAHYGSVALLRSTTTQPFHQVAHRIAPWLVARAARERGAAPAEVRLAAQILDNVVRRNAIEVPDPGSQLSIDEARRAESPFAISLAPGRTVEGDEVARINAAMDRDASELAAQRAVETATARIRAARSGGAALYLATFDPDDLAPVLVHAEDVVDRWLEGLAEVTDGFRRRVRLAEGFYISLVEAMTRGDTDRGLALWRAVRSVLTTKFIGTAGVERMILILLAAPADDRVDELVRELVSPAVATTDETLLHLSVAAAAAGREGLLTAIAADDLASGVIWRAERGKALEALSTGSGAAPSFADGRGSPTEIRDGRWGEIRYRDAAARHWWEAYWAATDGEQAYASWILFKRAAGRRALEWSRRIWPDKTDDRLGRRKWIYAVSQLDDLKRAGEEQEKKLSGTLYLRKTVDDVTPWSRLGPINTL